MLVVSEVKEDSIDSGSVVRGQPRLGETKGEALTIFDSIGRFKPVGSG